MYLDLLAMVVNSGLITTTIDCKSRKNVHQFTHFHQFSLNFIGKDKVFHGLLSLNILVLQPYWGPNFGFEFHTAIAKVKLPSITPLGWVEYFYDEKNMITK